MKEILNLLRDNARLSASDIAAMTKKTPEEVEAEYATMAEESGTSIEEIKKYYDEPRAKEYIIDELKERKLFDELYKQVKVSKGDKVEFADLFKNN